MSGNKNVILYRRLKMKKRDEIYRQEKQESEKAGGGKET